MAELADSRASPSGDLLDPVAMSGHLRPLLDGDGRLPWRVVGVELIEEEPERRSVLAYTIESPHGRKRLIGRSVTAGRESVLDHMRTLDACLTQSSVRVSRPVGYLPQLGLLVTEHVGGRSLAHALYDPAGGDATGRRMGTAVAALHACTPGPGVDLNALGEIDRALRWEDGLVNGELRARFHRTLNALSATTATMNDAPKTTVHGSLTPDRFRLDRGRTVLLLTETLGVGDPAADLGHFRAFLATRALKFPDASSRCNAARSLVLDTYRSACGARAGERLDSRVRFYETTTLVRLSGVYGTRERWMSVLPPRLLDAAEALLEKGEVS